VTREELVRDLARVSHDAYLTQKVRDQGARLEDLPAETTPHDVERAEMTVTRLVELGVVSLYK
jgi:hypothetical protein